MRYTKEELEDLIFTQNLSYKAIGRMFEVSDQMIKKDAHKLGIQLKVRAKFPLSFVPANKGTRRYADTFCLNCGNKTNYFAKKYCNINCQCEHKHSIKYKHYLENQDTAMYYNMSTFKPDFLKEQDGECAICNIRQIWNNKPLTFILDHIDGRAGNNERSNLRLLCHNCDSQLDTYKSKNKNSDRKDRYLLNYKN